MSRPGGPPSTPGDAPKLSASAFDFLLIELVPMTYRLHASLEARDQELATQASLLHLFPARGGGGGGVPGQTGIKTGKTSSSSAAAAAAAASGKRSNTANTNTEDGGGGRVVAAGATAPSSTGTGNRTSSRVPATAAAGLEGGGGEGEGDEDEQVREAVFYRLEKLGYRVGQGLAERFAADLPRPNQPLDKIKFVCKELWTRVFRKQIDNLKTNHRGTFVLTDTRFQPLSRMSVDRKIGGARAVEVALARAQAFLWFPCGVVRGALQALGMDVTVNAETTDLPVATFQIRLVGAKP